MPRTTERWSQRSGSRSSLRDPMVTRCPSRPGAVFRSDDDTPSGGIRKGDESPKHRHRRREVPRVLQRLPLRQAEQFLEFHATKSTTKPGSVVQLRSSLWSPDEGRLRRRTGVVFVPCQVGAPGDQPLRRLSPQGRRLRRAFPHSAPARRCGREQTSRDSLRARGPGGEDSVAQATASFFRPTLHPIWMHFAA